MYRKSILILGSFSPGALEQQYVKNLEMQGWNTKCTDIQLPANLVKNKNLITKTIHYVNPSYYYSEINKNVLSEAKQFSPLVILIFKGMELFPDTIKELRSYCKIICNYNPDHPFQFYSRGAGNINVEKSIPLFDTYFTYSKSILNKLKHRYGIDSFCIPFGYNEKLTPVKTHLSEVSKSFLFIGGWDKERQKKLKEINNVSLLVYGPKIWAAKLGNSGMINYNDKQMYDQLYADACFEAKGIVNLLRPQNIVEQSHNMRTFEVPGFGGLLISQRTSEQLSFFEEDKEAIFFEDTEELNDKLKFYLTRDTLVEKIKQQALMRSKKSDYNYQKRTEMLVSYILNKID